MATYIADEVPCRKCGRPASRLRVPCEIGDPTKMAAISCNNRECRFQGWEGILLTPGRLIAKVLGALHARYADLRGFRLRIFVVRKSRR